MKDIKKASNDKKPGIYRWMVLFLTTFTQSCNSIIIYGVASIAPFLVASLNLTKLQIGLTGGAVNIGMSLTALLAGRMVDLHGEKRILTLGIIGAGLFIILASFARSFTFFFILLLCVGIWAISVTPAGGKAIINWFPLSQRGFALGVRQTGVPAGGIIASLLLPPLAVFYGWQTSLASAGIIGITAGLIFYFLYREIPENLPKKSSALLNYRNILVDKNIWLASAMGICFVGAQYILITYIQLYLHEEMGYPVLVASKFLALVQLGGVIGRISWGAISDTLFGSSRKPVLLLVGLLAATLALMMLLVTPKTPSWWIAAIVFLLGFTAIGWNGLFVALIAELAGGPANAATAIGLGMNTNQIGKVLLPPLFGLLVDTTGSYRLSWIFLSALGFAGVIFVSRVRERKTGGKRAACPGIQHSPGM